MFYSITFCQLLQIILQLLIKWYFLDDFWIISCQSSRIPQPTAPRNSGACVVRGAVLGGSVTGGGLRMAENHWETGMISTISRKQAYKTLLKPNKQQRFLLLVNDSKSSINIEHMHMSYLFHEFHGIFEYLNIFDMMIFVNPCESHLVPASSTVSSTLRCHGTSAVPGYSSARCSVGPGSSSPGSTRWIPAWPGRLHGLHGLHGLPINYRYIYICIYI